MLCYTIFIFFVGCNFAIKRFGACFLAESLEFILDVDFILLVLECLEPPDLTDALEERSL
jgi:hypothetical protein